MNNEQLCPEHEAARIAGVSLRTLLRFSEAGYLTLHNVSDGSYMYERAQVEEIFGASATACNQISTVQSTTLSGNTPDAPSSVEDIIPVCEAVATQVSEQDTDNRYNELNEDRSASVASTPDAQTDLLSHEVSRLRNLLAMQERILDSKDDEIADLRSQRAWLRERIEKLEEKSDRDQILLLSETQTIRSLIAYQESRKSTFRQLLEWTGLVRDSNTAALPQPQSNDHTSKHPVTPSSSRTIEVSKAANY
jgi:hypothetical protein